MVRWVLAGLVLLVMGAGPFAAAYAQPTQVHAAVDRTMVRENESFVLTVRAEGTVREEPDLQPLLTDFEILQRASSTSVRIVAGRTTRLTEWSFTMMPLRAGGVTLPPLNVSGVYTAPLDLTVMPAPDSAAQGDVFVEIEVEPETPYVQAQVTYTLRLYAADHTSRATLTVPEIVEGDAIIERITEDREYETVLEGRRFRVRERRYVIFPQAPGTVTVAPVTFEATIMPSRGASRVQRVRSRPVELQVRNPVPPPPEWPGATWLPASSLTLTERWSDDRRDLVAGTPRTRSIVIEADGLDETQLPALSLAPVNGVRHFAGQVELNRRYTESGLRASREQPFAVLAQGEGAVQLPAVELPWWNTNLHRWEVARLPARDLNVLPASDPEPADSDAVSGEPMATTGGGSSPWLWVSGALLAAWLVTLGILLRHRVPGLLMSVPLPKRFAKRRLLRQLRAACAADDGATARQLLLQFAKLHFRPPVPGTLDELAARVPEKSAEAIMELQANRYGPGRNPWRGERLQRALESLDSLAHGASSHRSDPLQPLYR